MGKGSTTRQLKEINPVLYLKQQPNLHREQIIKFITEQFSGAGSYTQTQIDSCFAVGVKYGYNIMRFQIINQVLYAKAVETSWIAKKSKFFSEITKYLNTLVSKYSISNVDLLLWHSEKVTGELYQEMKDCPYFLFSKSSSPYDLKKFLFPNFFMTTPEWKSLTSAIEHAKSVYLYETKAEKIFWRGAPTGSLHLLPEKGGLPYYGMDVFDKLPRLSLVLFSKLYPDLIDAKFTDKPRLYKSNKNNNTLALDVVFDKLSLVGNTVSEVDHLNFKYLVSIDGNTCAWKRVPWIMLSNSVLFKQETDRIEWFYSALEAYKHYIPINENITDIFSQLQWAKTHDSEVRKISENAQLLVKNELMHEHIEAHCVIILNGYNRLFDGVELLATLPQVDSSFMHTEF